MGERRHVLEEVGERPTSSIKLGSGRASHALPVYLIEESVVMCRSPTSSIKEEVGERHTLSHFLYL